MAYEPNEFGYKDALPSGDPDKVIKGSDFDIEFNAIKDALDDISLDVDGIDGLQDALDDKADKSDLEQEIQHRISGDAALQGQIDNFENYDDSEIRADLAQETADRKEGDQALQGNIDGVSANLSQEIRDRQNADTALGDRIDNLVTDDLADVNSENAKLDQFLIHNGSQWVAEDFHIDTELTYQGGISVVSDPAPSANNGDLYINNEAGTVGASWTGIAGNTITPAVAVGWSDKNARWYMLGDIASAAVMRVEAGLGIDVDDTKPAEPVVSIDRTETDKWYAPLWEQNGDDIYYDKGNVGINRIPNNNYKLDVAGSARFTTGANVSDEFSEIYLGGHSVNVRQAKIRKGTGGTENQALQYYAATGGSSGEHEFYLNNVDIAMKIASDGNVGIGGEPSRSTKEIEDEAVATLATWDSKDKKPTKAELIKSLTERNIGGGTAKLQVSGNAFASGQLQTNNGQISRPGMDVGLFFNNERLTSMTGSGNYLDATMDLGKADARWKNSYLSGNVNAGGIVTTGQHINVNSNGYIRGEYDGELRLQSGSSKISFYSNQNNKELAYIDNSGGAYFSGTIYGAVDDVPSHVKNITPTQIANWDAGTGGGGGGATTDGRISDTQITNWDHAYDWGNHASAGYQPAGSYADANHNHSGVYQPAGDYLTPSSLNGYATESWVSSNYQPKGNYALVGASYTKAESDAKYELKGEGGGGLPDGDWICEGSIYAKGNVSAYYASDERLKDDITAMPIGLIDSIKPVTWRWKESGKDSGGVVAQQLQECGLEDWVNEAPNGDLGVDYNALIGVLLAEVKDLKLRVKELEG